jgi:plasmid stability protein
MEFENGDLLIENINDETMAALAERAAANNRTLEDEVIAILVTAYPSPNMYTPPKGAPS